MRASKLIEQLQQVIAEHGDIEVVTENDDEVSVVEFNDDPDDDDNPREPVVVVS